MSDQVTPKVSVLLGPFAKNGSPKGSLLELLLGSILEGFWIHFGADFGTILGAFSNRFWTILEPMSAYVWNNVSFVFGIAPWNSFGTIL